jgi:hypothetical protein
MTSHGRHRRSHLRAVPAVVLAVVAAGLVALMIAILQQPDDRATTAEPPSRSGATAVTSAVEASLAATCRTAVALAERDLQSADAAMVHWRRHITAMTDLVAGRMTLAQATEFWDATRVAGKRTVTTWQRADGEFRRGSRSCLESSSAGSGPGASCQVRTSAAAVLLATERASLRDWRRHIRQMESLRAGRITPEHALHLWDAMYQRGLSGLRQVDEATKAFREVPATCAR